MDTSLISYQRFFPTSLSNRNKALDKYQKEGKNEIAAVISAESESHDGSSGNEENPQND